MKKQIYILKLKDGKTIISDSRTKLLKNLKEYITSTYEPKDGYYWLSPTQLDNLIYSRVLKNKFKYIDSFQRCFVDDIFNFENQLKYNKPNGEPITTKYIRQQHNNLVNKKVKEIIEGKIELPMNKMTCISV